MEYDGKLQEVDGNQQGKWQVADHDFNLLSVSEVTLQAVTPGTGLCTTINPYEGGLSRHEMLGTYLGMG